MQAPTVTMKPKSRESLGSFTFRVTEDSKTLFDQVRAICKKNNWTISSAIVVALQDWAAKHGGK